jgi:N-acyl-D-amino-acid deacylase
LRIIDAQDKCVVPGFIDVHTHCDSGIVDPEKKEALNYLYQGVTTLVGGNCGSGTFRVTDYFGTMEEQGIGLNIVHLLGHGHWASGRNARIQESRIDQGRICGRCGGF